MKNSNSLVIGILTAFLLAVAASVVADTCYKNYIEASTHCSGSQGYPDRRFFTEYNPDCCAYVWDPNSYDATPENAFGGQYRDQSLYGVECPCEDDMFIGDTAADSRVLSGDWLPGTYNQYCNHCGT